jgi:hypothetical protein
MRRIFTEAWRKLRENEPLDPLEQLIVRIVHQHPEYHVLLETEEAALDRDYRPEDGESNPFLHLGMHISLHEQIDTDRPAGITALHREMMLKIGDPHQVEHQLMECLGRMLWEAQRAQRLPDEQAYLECVRSLLR